MLSRVASSMARFRRLTTKPIRFCQHSSTNLSTETTTTRIPVHAQRSNFPLPIHHFFSPSFSSSWRGDELFTQQQRPFSSRRPGINKKNEKETLINENLIKALMKQHAATTPNDIMVRLVIDEGHEKPATVEVVSLADAIQTSVDRMTDLIGTSLDTDPPVIRAAQLSKLEYKKGQSQKKNKAPKYEKKAFRFRAGIDDHDLERKINDLNKFLERGLDCNYSVFSKAKVRRRNQDAGMELVERIQELISAHGVLKRPPQKNEQGNYIQVQLEPKKK